MSRPWSHLRNSCSSRTGGSSLCSCKLLATVSLMFIARPVHRTEDSCLFKASSSITATYTGIAGPQKRRIWETRNPLQCQFNQSTEIIISASLFVESFWKKWAIWKVRKNRAVCVIISWVFRERTCPSTLGKEVRTEICSEIRHYVSHSLETMWLKNKNKNQTRGQQCLMGYDLVLAVGGSVEL